MDEMLLDAEGAARFLLDSCGIGEPMIDPYFIAKEWGYRARLGRRSHTLGPLLTIRQNQSETRQRFDLAHELAHIVAKHVGLDEHCERLANQVASAILMPDSAFKRDLSASDWCLDDLTSAYGVSYETAARRVVHVRGAVVSVLDNGRLSRRWRSPWLQGRGFSQKRLPSWEGDLAAECRSTAAGIDTGGARAYFVESSGWERVVVLTQVSEWESRCAYSRPVGSCG